MSEGVIPPVSAGKYGNGKTLPMKAFDLIPGKRRWSGSRGGTGRV